MTPEVIVPSSLQISGRGARGSRQGEPGSTCSSLNPPSPIASAPGAEPTFLEATPRSLSILYNPGNMQEGPCIRRGGVNGPSLSHQSQACRLLPSEGRVGSIGCWSTPPLSSVAKSSPTLPHPLDWSTPRFPLQHPFLLFVVIFLYISYFYLIITNCIKRNKEGGEALGLPLSASPSIPHP